MSDALEKERIEYISKIFIPKFMRGAIPQRDHDILAETYERTLGIGSPEDKKQSLAEWKQQGDAYTDWKKALVAELDEIYTEHKKGKNWEQISVATLSSSYSPGARSQQTAPIPQQTGQRPQQTRPGPQQIGPGPGGPLGPQRPQTEQAPDISPLISNLYQAQDIPQSQPQPTYIPPTTLQPVGTGTGSSPAVMISGAINSLNSEISQLENKSQELDNIINAMRQNSIACKETKQISNDFKSKIQELTSENNTLTTKIDFYNRQIETIYNRVKKIDERILEYKSMGGHDGEVEALEAEKEKTIDNIKNIEENVKESEEDQDKVQETQENIEEEKTNVDVILVSLKDDQQNLKKIYSGYIRKINKLNKKVLSIVDLVEQKGTPKMRANMGFARVHASAFGLI